MLLLVLIGLNLTGALVAAIVGEWRTSAGFLALAGATGVGYLYVRHVRPKASLEQQKVAWAIASAALFAWATLTVVEVAPGSLVDAVLLYVASSGGVLVVYGIHRALRS